LSTEVHEYCLSLLAQVGHPFALVPLKQVLHATSLRLEQWQLQQGFEGAVDWVLRPTHAATNTSHRITVVVANPRLYPWSPAAACI
jgi:hypothetical protein